MQVAIIMGSFSDHEIGLEVARQLEAFGVAWDMKVFSAHRSLEGALAYIDEMEEAGVQVFIGIAGKAAHLAGVIAGHTTKPVIGIPAKSSFGGGMDSLLSTVQMPSGVPVATVAVNGGKNAAILATQILATGDEALAQKLKDFKRGLAEDVRGMNEQLEEAVREKL
ncbi:MAG: 5-(carboxyamino)imidazole ribonucleotide mutase [Tissierellia bacterium]|nr:5-(carboxyamino)imidazole ribonucleotide mutase [Tissierellia bacterium]